jgi:tetratricopeptide (TPR) repeat protein
MTSAVRGALLSVCALLATAPAAWANGGGSMSMPDIRPREQTPQDKAKDFYNSGVHELKKADKYQAFASEQNDARKKDKALHEAQEYYTHALGRFKQAAQNDPTLPEAWNYIGYASRKLGNYDIALQAYEQALSLKPGYPDALEYRGEAFLGLNRITDAQQAYLDLFANNRVLAEKLLTAMKSWLETQRGSGTADANSVSELDKWIQERTTIAAQTASLTREGAALSWR